MPAPYFVRTALEQLLEHYKHHFVISDLKLSETCKFRGAICVLGTDRKHSAARKDGLSAESDSSVCGAEPANMSNVEGQGVYVGLLSVICCIFLGGL